MPTHELEDVRASIEAIRASMLVWAERSTHVQTSPTKVTQALSDEILSLVGDLVAIVDEIEDVMSVRKAQVMENRTKVNEIIVWIENADSLKLKLGGVPTPLPEIT